LSPQVEKEIKLRVAGAAAARRALRRAGARLVRPRHFEDNLLLDDRRFSLRSRGEVLRLRRTPDASILTFKGRRLDAGPIKSRPETEVMVGDADLMLGILASVGFRPTFRYQKYRETWARDGAEIVIDETPVGTFLEIEGPPRAIHRTAAALGFARRDYITDSYVGLFLEAGGRGDMVFR
jgi:adenylate cyclase class 2